MQDRLMQFRWSELHKGWADQVGRRPDLLFYLEVMFRKNISLCAAATTAAVQKNYILIYPDWFFWDGGLGEGLLFF